MTTGKAIVAMARGIGGVKKRIGSAEKKLEHHSELLEQLASGQEELLRAVKQIQIASTSLASSVGLAMSELATSRSLERRIERLEAAVFPPKH